MASRQEILKLPRKDQLNHVNCPPDLWWMNAKEFPILAMLSPTYDLQILAEPDRWLVMEAENNTQWVMKHLEVLTPSELKELSSDVLSLGVTCYQRNTRNHPPIFDMAVQEAKKCLKGDTRGATNILRGLRLIDTVANAPLYQLIVLAEQVLFVCRMSDESVLARHSAPYNDFMDRRISLNPILNFFPLRSYLRLTPEEIVGPWRLMIKYLLPPRMEETP